MAIVSIGTQTTTQSLSGISVATRFVTVSRNSTPYNFINLVTNSKTVFARNSSAVSLVNIGTRHDDKYIENGFIQPNKKIEVELFGDVYSNTVTPIIYQFWS
jgi:hypothetical protein